MTRFAYQVRNEFGQVESGSLDAYDATEAGSQLRQQGKMVMSLEAESGGGAVGPKLKKIRSDDVIFFANQLAVMVDTGVPLSEASWATIVPLESSASMPVSGTTTERRVGPPGGSRT